MTIACYATWRVEDVCSWLEGAGLGHLAPAFRRHAVTGADLPLLTAKDLTESFECTPFQLPPGGSQEQHAVQQHSAQQAAVAGGHVMAAASSKDWQGAEAAPWSATPPPPPPQQQQQLVAAGASFQAENYCGPITWIIGVCLFPCICFCPLDQRLVPMAVPVATVPASPPAQLPPPVR
ncbi:WD SAM and U-box domain-containing 1-like isoform X2 [Chlorella sorokiniana]|uniref:WD SAM and U-box domain-containing 1-like isoform X2 n=1 Tax=Chlorella sorokiniana TaxID=3076 RepID=A0A2P6TLR4_CHLSO|nr:WD SAM and U-box domain-containing 1-like isoform X2 [Chlorella sorokiniana]|eukprot:PRW45215.1 WD SAM and U-box domain-containing 1-like isoform X2 [Chlorella sorokiniana]